MNEAPRIANVSEADLSWTANEEFMAHQSIESEDGADVNQGTDVEMSDGEVDDREEVDLDVADDTDQWL